MAAAASSAGTGPNKLGLAAQDPVTIHRMATRVVASTTIYEGANGSVFRYIRTLSKCLTGHMLLVQKMRVVSDPVTGAPRYVDTEERRAIKRLVKYNVHNKVSLDGRRISDDFSKELAAMDYLCKSPHDNVMRMFAAYEDDVHYFLELECLAGGDLFEAVQTSPGGKFDEDRARKVLLQMLQGLCFMHGRGIIHRDLSLENAMLDRPGEEGKVKIIDMGLVVDRWAHPPGPLPPLGCVGKASYMPPEIYLNAEFDESADIWCVGVMVFMMLFGVPPYRKPHGDLCALFREIQEGRLLDLLARWGMSGTVSPDGQDLVRRMLTPRPTERPTIPEILAHPWMAPAVAPLGGSSKAPQQANFILEVGQRVHQVLHRQRQQQITVVAAATASSSSSSSSSAAAAAAAAAAAGGGGSGPTTASSSSSMR